MIDVKQAVQKAQRYIKELYPSEQLVDVLLEEVERTEDDRFWLITLSFSQPNPRTTVDPIMPSLNIFDAFRQKTLNRAYKVFKIDADTGEVVSMKMHALAA